MAIFLAAPIYWGIGLLVAGGASIVALQQYQDDDLDLGRIDLDDLLGRNQDPDPEPERDPLSSLIRIEALRQLVEAQISARERLDDEDCEDCLKCKPYDEGNDVSHNFGAGTVSNPSPRGRGALFQHYVVPWFPLRARDEGGGALRVDIGEWEWRLGRMQSWDGLDFLACKLIEVKLGYRDFLDETKIGRNNAHTLISPKKPFLGTLHDAFIDQLMTQVATVRSAQPSLAILEWVFSDNEVNWQFVALCGNYGYTDVRNRVQPFPLAPNGTKFVRELYTDGPELFGYWEDTT